MARMSNHDNALITSRDNGPVQSPVDNDATMSRMNRPDHPCPPDATLVHLGDRPMTSHLPSAATASPFIRPDGLMMSDILLKLDVLDC